jgi:tetratricopeptide (TPR) repeat protein
MSPRRRILVIAAAAAALAAGGTVALAMITATDEGGGENAAGLTGAPPLVLDLGVRADPEARALRRAERLYARKRREAAGRIFERFSSPEARIGAVLAAWSDASLAKIERLAEERPRNALVLLHLGYASLWSGRREAANAAWRRAAQAQPDSPSAQRADDALHPDFPSGQPLFVPSFAPPAGLRRLSPPAQLASLARRARHADPHAKLLYGLALQRLGHRISARRQYDSAAALAPRDPEAKVAAAVARFDKSRPAEAFSRLGPLTRRYPHAATVRFHLGLLLLWLARTQPGSVDEGKRQLRLARAEEPASSLAREATRILVRLENVRTR